MEDIKKLALQEKAKRELEKRHADKHNSLISFIEYFFEQELHKSFTSNWHYKIISKELEELRDGVTKKLIINVPPRTGKTELITKCFPAWLLGQQPEHKFIVSGYSSTLTKNFSSQARDYYQSKTYKTIFPRRSPLREDQNTKELWETERGGYYYATGAGGSITGYGADTFIIDDPIKPDEADSDIVRTGINNWFGNTVISRLNNMSKGNIIIIMQRVHGDDLAGHLLEEMKQGTGYDWKLLSFPAIATEDEYFNLDGEVLGRKEGETLDADRMPLQALEKIKETMGNVYFSTQYQQNPLDKESQEFHQEWFRYEEYPSGGRIFTTVDPAFTKNKSSDSSAIVTGSFIGDKMYVLEYTVGKYDVGELIDKMVYHIKKWSPEKIGIEAFAAQVTVGFGLRAELEKRGMYCPVEDIRQAGDKESKIRRLLPLYRNGLIFHKRDMEALEKQLLEFPRGKHDDLCFVAGTKILTQFGYKNIENIKAGDKVITPFGLSLVKVSKITGKKEVITKFGLTCTSNHKVFSFGKGFIPIDNIQNIDTIQMLSINNLIKWNILKQLYLIELNTELCERENITYLSQKVINEEKMQNDYMLPSMKTIIKLMLKKGGVFIIKTMIHLIMILKIWSLSKLANMLVSTEKKDGKIIMNIKKNNLNILQKGERGQKNGIKVKNDINGIVNIGKIVFGNAIHKNGEIVTRLLKVVKNVLQNFKHGKKGEYIAHQNVLVKYHEDLEKKEVYNLTVEAGCYYANDILVSNCDATQMLYDMYTLQPNANKKFEIPRIEYDMNGRPIFNKTFSLQ